MGCTCIVQSGECVGHICTGSNTRYLVYVRDFGCRNYQLVSRHRSKKAAIRRLGEAMLASQFVKRGMVALIQDYYDPEPLYEVVLR